MRKGEEKESLIKIIENILSNTERHIQFRSQRARECKVIQCVLKKEEIVIH